MDKQSRLPGVGEKSDTEAVPEDKIKCYITGKLRDDTSEERVRQTVVRSLVNEYGYQKDDIDVEFTVKMGRQKKRADIVIFYEDESHTQENVYITVETKNEEVQPSNNDNGVGQLESYTAACMNTSYALWVGSERLAFEVIKKQGNRKLEEVPDIPKQGQNTVPKPTKGSLVPAVDLKNVFQRIHNYVYANQGIQKDRAFEEILKIIFVKVYDERYSQTLQFYIMEHENIDIVRRRLNNLFGKVKTDYEYIFEDSDEIQLNDNVLQYVVSEIQRFTFVDTETDVKGEAYEELVGPNLRGDRGEFFTPRNVCNMTVEMVFSLLDQEALASPGGVRILDPAVGTGGFLISSIKYVKQLFKARGLHSDQVRTRVKNVADKNLHGIDFNPFLVKVAQMNMVMHGDGSSNIVHANSLNQPDEWSSEAQSMVPLESFEAIVANPPFGTKAVVDDKSILNQYDLHTVNSANPRESLPPEQLFIERCLDFLKPGGIMGIVLPDSILSNPGLEWLRKWLLEQASILASIDLPIETFQPHTGTQTSVLILQKHKKTQQPPEDYDIFMAMPNSVGHDRRGKPVFEKTPSGDVRINEDGQPIIDDDLPMVSEKFEKWAKERGVSQ
jgi:type I restriction enzyme M protein